MVVRVGCIVEGHGEVEAVPILVDRIAYEIMNPPIAVNVVRPAHRISRTRLVRSGELERALEAVWRRAGAESRILVLVDSDDDCPAELGPELSRRATTWRSDVPTGIVLAKREYEAWFLAAASSLSGKRSLPSRFTSPADPENIRGAKQRITAALPDGRVYKETIDQAALTSEFDLHMARRNADSFDKCFREIARLLTIQ